MSDTDFWKTFRISPTRFENAILSRFPWVMAIIVSPLLLLILESAIISLLVHDELKPAIVFQDLSDPIFTFLTLATLLAGLVFVVRWRAQVEPAFRSLLDNDLITDQHSNDLSDSYGAYLRTYQRQLHSRKRFISVIFLIALILLISAVELGGRYTSFAEFFQASQDPLENLILLLHRATRWVLSAFLWGGFGGLALWVAGVTNRSVQNLTGRFQIQVQPMHPDRVGGLRRLGDLFTSLGLIVLVFCIPLAVFGISGTNKIIESRRCLDRLSFANRVLFPMAEQELVDCLTVINQAAFYQGYESIDARQDIYVVRAQGYSLDEIAGQMADEFLGRTFEGSPLEDTIIKNNRLPLFFVGGLVLVLSTAGALILRPLWSIHRSMSEQKERAVADLAQEATALHRSLDKEVENQRWEEAQATGVKLELVQRLMSTAAAAPSWPISYTWVLRDYLLPALLSAGLSYGLTRLNLLLPPEGELVLESLIGAFRGG